MAHYAELSADNTVLRVLVVNNEDCLDANGVESEAVGAGFLARLIGGRWVQTSYNARFRKHYAGIGYAYDRLLDAFIPPRPFPSWTLDPDTCEWLAPVPYPTDGQPYRWDEPTQSWLALA